MHSSSKKGQLGMIELLLVAMILGILLGIGIFLYFQFTGASLEQTVQELEIQESNTLLALALSLPEIECSRATSTRNCLDAAKLLSAQTVMNSQQNRPFYVQLFGFRNLKVEIIYPDVPQVECTSQNYPDCSSFTLFTNELPGGSKRAFSVITPIFYPESREVRAGRIVLEVFSR